MKKIIDLSRIILALMMIGCFFVQPVSASGVNKCTPAQTPALTAITLSSTISRVERIAYDAQLQKLFFVAALTDGRRSLWSLTADGKAKQLIVRDEPLYHGFVHIGEHHEIYFETDNPLLLYKSIDGGATFKLLNVDKEIFWNMAEDENGAMYGSAWSLSSPAIFKSNDRGETWRTWANFSALYPNEAVTYSPNDQRFKMRHLHDIIYTNGQLIVGTGDIARWTFLSKDRGMSWKKIWNEGLTSHLLIPEQNIMLMGADKDGGWGIAAYNFDTEKTTRVWNPLACGWAGYIYSIVKVGDAFYAGVHTENNTKLVYGILKSEDGKNWRPFLSKKTPNLKNTSLYLANGPEHTGYVSLNGQLYSFK